MPKQFIIGTFRSSALLSGSGPVEAKDNREYWSGLQISPNPVIQRSLAIAQKECERLAALYPSQVFIVLQAVSAHHTATPPLTKVEFK